MTVHRVVEFSDERAEAVAGLDAVAAGRGWCNVTPQIAADDVEVLSVNVFSLRVKRGAPVATYVTSPDKRGVQRSGTLGVLHTRGKLGRERIERLQDGAGFIVRQDHQQRGLLLEVPPGTSSDIILATMCALLDSLCDYERSGKWRMDVYERT